MDVYSGENDENEVELDTSQCQHNHQAIRLWIYLAHFSAHFTQNYWHFSLILLLSAISADSHSSILFVSAFGLCTNLGAFFVTPFLGKWVDRRRKGDQLQAIRWVLLGKYVTVILVALLGSWLLLIFIPPSQSDDGNESLTNLSQPWSVSSIVALGGIYIMGTGAQVLYQTFNIIVERNLVVVLSQYSSHQNVSQTEWLSKTNATMMQIGLIAPLMISVLLLEENMQYLCLIVGAVAVLALAVENFCMSRLFNIIPALEQRQASSSTEFDSNDTSCLENDFVQEDITVINRDSSLNNGIKNRWALKVYIDQPGAPAGLSLALLYANSITFGNGMFSAYLLNRGLSAGMIGFFRGISYSVGLLGTVAYTFSMSWYGLEVTGVWGLTTQAMSLAIAALLLIPTSDDNLLLFLSISSVCISRLGLFVAFITITQIQQLEIPEEHRCLIGGVQEGLNAVFALVSFGVGFLFPDPSDFVYVITIGCSSVVLALISFFFGVYVPRRYRLIDSEPQEVEVTASIT
eukprot:scaffold39334_cov67-Cyclotella_meneghiniana.AAC.8